MKEEISYVDVPEEYESIIGKPFPGSRLYKAVGTRQELIKWIATVDEICGDQGDISPGTAAAIVGVTRAAVHKRLKEGKLTGFCFYVVAKKKILLEISYLEESGRPNICSIPTSECIEWAKQFEKRKPVKPNTAKNERYEEEHDESFMKVPRNWRTKK